MNRDQRRDLYRLLGGLLQDCPKDELYQALLDSSALDILGKSLGGTLGESLRRMHGDVARGREAWPAITADYVALFLGPKKKRAPPWESVYRSPERLTMQEPEADVLRTYAAQRIGFEGMGQLPADHIALELQFCSMLVDRGRRRASARAALRDFLDDHVLRWVPAFAADVAGNASTDFFKGMGGALAALCAIEAGGVRQPDQPIA